ncbi:histidine phosphatase family protein [Euzebya sp.]|uniref:histidine phosphatase family protein n=1 Tax=Euzebya sp. TaxID=1971409 RepID=UPI003516BF5A
MCAQPAEPPEPVRQYRFRPPPGACDLLLVRHGESQPAVPGEDFPRVDGHGDPPLAEEGLREARAVADRLRHEEIAAIYTTPLTRTKQTAAPLAAALGLTPAVEPELREVHLGEWEGGEYRIRARAGDPIMQQVFEQEDWGCIPGAESMADFSTRVRRGIERIAAAHPDERVVAFVHGGVIGAVCHLATGSRPFAFVGAANASLNHIVVLGDSWVLRRFNDTGHLDTDLDKPVQPLT